MPSVLRSKGYKHGVENYVVPVNDINIQPGFNPRGIAYEDLQVDDLKAYIKVNGARVLPPLRVRMLDGQITLIAGHRRHKATSELIAEGEEIAGLSCEVYTVSSDAEAIALAMAENRGEPVSQLCQAKAFQRLVNYNWTVANIASKTGCSTVYVYNTLKLLELGDAETSPALQALSSGQITATDALQIAHETGKGEGSQEEITTKVVAKRAGKRANSAVARALPTKEEKVSFRLELQVKELLDDKGILPVLTIMVKYSSKEEIMDHLAAMEE